jgi:hypothetical protein
MCYILGALLHGVLYIVYSFVLYNFSDLFFVVINHSPPHHSYFHTRKTVLGTEEHCDCHLTHSLDHKIVPTPCHHKDNILYPIHACIPTLG